MKGAVLAYLYKDSKIQLYKDFNITSDMFIDEKTGIPLGQFRVDSFDVLTDWKKLTLRTDWGAFWPRS